jgi:hypothetical protein
MAGMYGSLLPIIRQRKDDEPESVSSPSNVALHIVILAFLFVLCVALHRIPLLALFCDLSVDRKRSTARTVDLNFIYFKGGRI